MDADLVEVVALSLGDVADAGLTLGPRREELLVLAGLTPARGRA